MSTSPQPSPSPRVRNLTRWRIPFHYAPPLVVAAIGVGMLLIGGVVGGFGGWVLAVALPIAIGAFLRSAWFALVPVAVWVGWLIYIRGAEPDAALSNTPFELALVLATIGAGATLLAQRAVFPATEPEAWRASIGRLVPPLDDGATPPLDDEIDEDALDDEVAAGLQVTDAELAEAERAAKPPIEPTADDATGAGAGEAADDAGSGDDAGTSDDAEPDAVDAVAAKAGADDADDEDDAAPGDAEPSEATVTSASVSLEKSGGADEATPSEADDAAQTELPVDADPSPLDEGGHVTEFTAISEADLEAGDDPAGDDDDSGDRLREPAHADSKAAQR